MDKVGWEYINGVPAINNLMMMIEVAIKQITQTPGWGTASEYRGYYFGKGQYWCGIYYAEPLELKFEMSASKYKVIDDELKNSFSYPLVESMGNTPLFVLDLENIHFFSLDKKQQVDEVAKFVKQAFLDAQKLNKKT